MKTCKIVNWKLLAGVKVIKNSRRNGLKSRTFVAGAIYD